MSETLDWGTEAKEQPKPKKRIPTWAWFCGGGCLLAVIAAIVAVVVIAMAARSMGDQDKQWAELKAELPFDERPADMQIIGTGVFTKLTPGVEDQWTLKRSSEELVVQVTKYAGKIGDEMRKNIESGELGDQASMHVGPFGLFHFDHGTAAIQGRELHWMTFQTYDEAEKAAGADKSADENADENADEQGGKGSRRHITFGEAMKQRMMWLDLTRDGGNTLIVQFQRMGPGSPLTPEEAAEFLAPFKVGETK